MTDTPAVKQESLKLVARKAMTQLKTDRPDAFDDAARQRQMFLVTFALFGLAGFALYDLDFSLSAIINGVTRLGRFAVLMFPPDPDRFLWTYLHAMLETLAIAFLGTLIAAVIAFPLGWLAARNVIGNPFAHFAVRRFLDVSRGVDTLVWALIWVSVVGLGPFAGVLALVCSDIGAFGKLFSEAIETADRKPIEGVTAAGGSRIAALRFAVLPQIIPVIVSQVLYFFESNTRSATIIGIVGAGGIGQPLSEAIRMLDLQQVSFLVLLILVAVAVIDFISTRIQTAMIGPSRP